MFRPALALALAVSALPAVAGEITSPADPARLAAVDILAARVTIDGRTAVFQMTLSGTAGATDLAPAGALAGAPVHAYVWPTSLDPAAVGFEPATGILALVATAHPDFDDTPLYDEDADGSLVNDGWKWHSHWVVLTPSPDCGEGALAVRDIPAGATPRLPATWPGLPLLIDSPGYSPVLSGAEITLRVPLPAVTGLESASFDGVTAALRVNANLHAPLLCVTDVFDVASGELSLPGKVN